MEKSLFEKLKNGTCDEIDKDMIAARVKVVHQELLSCLKDLGELTEKISRICEEHKEEAFIIGFRFIMAASDDVTEQIYAIPEEKCRDVLCKTVLGSREDTKALLRAVSETIDRE